MLRLDSQLSVVRCPGDTATANAQPADSSATLGSGTLDKNKAEFDLHDRIKKAVEEDRNCMMMSAHSQEEREDVAVQPYPNIHGQLLASSRRFDFLERDLVQHTQSLIGGDEAARTLIAQTTWRG